MSDLSERAMLASLHISSWGGMAIDQDVTDAVNADFKADKKAGRYNKRLVASVFFTGIASSHSMMKKIHRLMTLPWEDNGTRILATANYINYTKKMQDAKRKSEDEVKAFLEQRDEFIREAKTRLGDMFNKDDYPTVDDLREKFGIDVEVKGMPAAKDFRAKLSDEATKAIVRDIERRTNKRLEAAMKDVFNRAEEVIGHMAERLRAYTPPTEGNRASGTIRDTTIYNINELAELMPALNVTDDPRIAELAQQMKGELVEHSPEILRADAKVRKETLAKADKLLKKVQGYLK